jgi:hypothetical protein
MKESEKEHSDWLLGVSNGRSGANVYLLLSCFSNTCDSVEQLYGDINFITVTAQQVNGRTMLSVTNEDSLDLIPIKS